MKKEMKPLTERLKPFLAYSASFYANGSHRFKFDTTFVTTMAILIWNIRIRHCGMVIQCPKWRRKLRKKLKKIFGSNYKYKFAYTGTYPGYVYRPTGNTIVFNSMRIRERLSDESEKITEYEEGNTVLRWKHIWRIRAVVSKEYRKNTKCIWKKTTAPNLGLLSVKLNYKKSTWKRTDSAESVLWILCN